MNLEFTKIQMTQNLCTCASPIHLYMIQFISNRSHSIQFIQSINNKKNKTHHSINHNSIDIPSSSSSSSIRTYSLI